jgi:hypothetical protein
MKGCGCMAPPRLAGPALTSGDLAHAIGPALQEALA